MDKLQELKELMKGLSPEEVEEIKAFLNGTAVEDTESKEEAEPVMEKTEADAEPSTEEVATTEETEESVPAESTDEEPVDETTAESLPAEETTSTEETPVEDSEAIETEETSDEEVAEETPVEDSEVKEAADETAPADEEEMPMMKKGVAAPEEDVESVPTQNITADDGSELPVDYEEIIEGLNAKIAAVEAENKMLKSKYEGAFGFSAKPSAPAKVNRLYDDGADDIHFHK